MTISSTVDQISFNANGTTTTYPFAYPFFALSDLVVSLINATSFTSTVQTLNGLGTYDYTITGSQDSATGEYLSGGSVVFNTAPLAGTIVAIKRAVPATQNTTLNNNTLFPAKAVEAALDRVTMLTQQAADQAALCLTVPPFDPAIGNLVIPSMTARAGTVLGFNALGEPVPLPVTLVTVTSLVTPQAYGALGNGVANDTAAVLAASAAAVNGVFMQSGTYKTTLSPSALNGVFWGPGQIQDTNGNTRGKFFSTLQAPPTSISANIYSSDTIFDGDYSHQFFSIEHRIYGATTLGTPATAFTENTNCFPFVGYLVNASGYQASPAGTAGQTGAAFAWLNCESRGQGNTCAVVANVQGYSSYNGVATSWEAYPSLSLFTGQVTAGATGQYLNPVEIHCVDNGYQSASINFVANQYRSNASAPLGEPWIGYRSQNQGSQPSDGALSIAGNYTIGIDTTAGVFYNNAAMTVAAEGRIYLNAQSTNTYPGGVSLGTAYLTCDAGTVSLVNGTGASQQLVVTPTSTGSKGSFLPSADNTYTNGGSGNRWSAIWAVNGTIQTSDPSLKTDITPLPAMLPLVQSIEPKTWKWKIGGVEAETSEETHEVPDTETIEFVEETTEIRNGKPVLVRTPKTIERPLYDDVPLFDEAGEPVMVNVAGKRQAPRLVQKTHRVARMKTVTGPVTKQVERAGRRTHWGFLASDVKAAFDGIGKDFGGYVQDEQGVQHLRPDQLLAVLWKAVQELSAEVAGLKQNKASA